MPKTTMGRRSIFRDKIKDSKYRVQGLLTKVGSAEFEAARRRLAKLADCDTASDADTIEYLARGEPNTRAYIQQQQGDGVLRSATE